MYENELKEYLISLGASLVGFADLNNINFKLSDTMKFGIAIAVKIQCNIIENINDGPTEDYFREYNRINKILNDITVSCTNFIEEKGYKAVGQTSTYVTTDDNLTTSLPHKTVATRAGLGWIGKNALLVTHEYGSAIRLSSIITDMPLKTDIPINESKCERCISCVVACPAAAIKNTLWNVNTKREQLIEPLKCRQKARELLKQKIGIEMSLCGKCIEVCPFTKKIYKENVIMYRLRKANNDDYNFIFNLNKTVYKDYIIKVWGSWDDEFQKQFCENRFKSGKIQIISDGERDIGILELIEKENQIYIEELQIEPNSQRRGIGTEIINDIKKTAFELNNSVGLMVLKINNRAKKLYEKSGFKVIDETETHFIMEVLKMVIHI